MTASDISPRALDRVGAAAIARGLTIACVRVDANAADAFEPRAFDLVSAHYASTPRTPDSRAIVNLLDAVAPGGALLVVGHDLEAMRSHSHAHDASRTFDPDAYVRVEDFVAVLATSPDWDIKVNGKRPRPPGAASSHHVDDIVLRAERAAVADDAAGT